MLAETLQGQIDEIDAQIQRVKDLARAQVEQLMRRRAILVKAQSLLTPDIEASFTALKDLGIIK
jgi:hypothetical protein